MPDHREVTILGKPLRCPVCENSEFEERQGQLNTKVATFFDLDWTNPQATCYICSRCHYIQWFLEPPA